MRRAAAVLAVALTLAACGSGGEESADGEVTGTLTVLAAASLTDAFTDLGAQLEQTYPGLDVRFSFAGSSSLAAQIQQGAPADVFASADQAQMERVVDAGLAADPAVFARNVLMVAVPPGNPGEISGFRDLAREDLALAVCAPEVPCGAAAERVFDALGIDVRPDTYEEDVRAVLSKVQLGEVDAGVVYRSDVVAAHDTVEGFAEPGLPESGTEYPIATLADAPNPAAARAFVDLVLSAAGREALVRAGFTEP